MAGRAVGRRSGSGVPYARVCGGCRREIGCVADVAVVGRGGWPFRRCGIGIMTACTVESRSGQRTERLRRQSGVRPYERHRGMTESVLRPGRESGRMAGRTVGRRSAGRVGDAGVRAARRRRSELRPVADITVARNSGAGPFQSEEAGARSGLMT